MAGLAKKDKEFWEYIESMDIINLQETWVDEKEWEKLKNRLHKNFIWHARHAKKVKRKGRAKGGMLIGIRKEEFGEGSKFTDEEKEGCICTTLKKEGKTKKIYAIYNTGNLEEGINWLKEIEEKWDEEIIIGGDFNIRTGNLGLFYNEKEGELIKRQSKDKKKPNKEGEKLMETVENKGWFVLNGVKEGDEEGEFTYVGGAGNSVIDYVFINNKGWENVESFKVADRVESDHVPVIVELKEKGNKREKEEEKKKTVISWREEDIAIYRTKLEEWKEQENTNGTVEEEWERLKKAVQEAMVKKVVKVKDTKIGYRKWWDKECTRKKKEVKIKYKRWKKGKEDKKNYIEERKNLRVLCKDKEKKRRKEEEAELRNIKSENEAWTFINRFRKRKVKVENSIEKEEWRRHFRELLEGEDQKIEGEKRQNIEEDQEITQEEIRKAIKKAKKKKAAGADGITNEAWIYGGEVIVEKLGNIFNRVWKGEGVPEDWKKAVIVPLYKKGDKERAANYRGISLLCTAYKIYTEILREKLEKEMERCDCIPEGQAGFRKGRTTMENIYILNHLGQRAIKRKKRLYVTFVDLKAAFDTVCREKLWEVMEEAGIGKFLIERIKELYTETKSCVRVGEEKTEDFWTKKGVRQGCLLSPALFNIYIANLEEKLKERNIGGIKIGNVRTWSLAYADDMALLAEGREAMIDMLETMRRFFRKRELILSTEKTKVMVFGRKGREKVEKWSWEGKEMEEVKDFKYLGFTFERNG